MTAETPGAGTAIDADPYAWFERELADTDIGPATCAPGYDAGERMDWDLAVAALFRDRTRH